MKLIRNTKNKITTDENAENQPHLKIREVVLVHCNIANNCVIVLYTFVPTKSFGQLLDTSPKTFYIL